MRTMKYLTASIIILAFCLTMIAIVAIAAHQRDNLNCWQYQRESIWICRQTVKKHCYKYSFKK
jgi:hypothetical protein